MPRINAGTIVDISPDLLPSAYVKPSVTTFTHEYLQTTTLTISKASVENVAPETTFQNIVSAITTAVNTQIDADYDVTTPTVNVYTRLKAVRTNFVLAETLYTNGSINYICEVEIYIATS